MKRTRPLRILSLGLTGLIALVAAVVALGVSGGDDALAVKNAAHGKKTKITEKELALRNDMRRLWEDHVTWTRLAIVTFADGSPGFNATAARLLQNQTDIGDAIKPFYGDAAGNQLTALLHDHITIAVELLQAATSGDAGAFEAAKARWQANANEIADFLSAANPRFWPRDEMRADMRTHLDQTLTEAGHELSGDYAASVSDYEAVHAHILAMADMLSAGIMHQFPARFR